MAYCIRCGANAIDSEFCPQCGMRMQTSSGTETLDSVDRKGVSDTTFAKPADATTLNPAVDATTALPAADATTFQPAVDATEMRPAPMADETAMRPFSSPVAAPLPTLPVLKQPVPEVRAPKRWTAPRMTTAALILVGAVAAGFLGTYFLIPTEHTVTNAKSNVIPPPLPKPVAGAAASYADAPAATTNEGKAYLALSQIAARDKPTLQSNQLWRAQIASSPATQSAVKFLKRYQKYLASQPDLLLAWSGDWPHTWGPSSSRSWVLLSSRTNTRTAPILAACARKPVADRCWAIRLSTVGSNADNEDVDKPDPSKN